MLFMGELVGFATKIISYSNQDRVMAISPIKCYQLSNFVIRVRNFPLYEVHLKDYRASPKLNRSFVNHVSIN